MAKKANDMLCCINKQIGSWSKVLLLSAWYCVWNCFSSIVSTFRFPFTRNTLRNCKKFLKLFLKKSLKLFRDRNMMDKKQFSWHLLGGAQWKLRNECTHQWWVVLLRGQYWDQAFSNIFFGNVDSGIECTINEFADNMKPCDVINTMEVKDVI